MAGMGQKTNRTKCSKHQEIARAQELYLGAGDKEQNMYFLLYHNSTKLINRAFKDLIQKWTELKAIDKLAIMVTNFNQPLSNNCQNKQTTKINGDIEVTNNIINQIKD